MFRNPFATLGADKKARLGSQQQQQPQQRKKQSAAAEPEQTEEELAAAAERKREKNRLKRAKKKAKAGGAASSSSSASNGAAAAAEQEDDSDDEEGPPSRASTPLAANGNTGAAAAKAKAKEAEAEEEEESESEEEQEEEEDEEEDEEEESEEEEAEEKPVAAAAVSSSEEEEDEDEEEESDEETEDADEEEEEEESDEEDEEDDDAAAAIDAKIVSLGHDAGVVSAVRSQLESQGIEVNLEMLLLYVQQDEQLAEERRTGKITVFKPKVAQKPTRPPIVKQAVAAPAKATAATTAAPAPAAAAGKKGAAAPAPAAAAAAAAAAASKAAPAAAKGARNARGAAAASAAPVAPAAAPVAVASAAALPLPSRDDPTVAGLERSARAWNPITEPAAALSLLGDWNALLERANTAQQSRSAAAPDAAASAALEFARAFLDSSALEILVRQCLTVAWVSAAEGHKDARVLDAALLQLLKLTVPGRKPADHQFMLGALRGLARTLEKTSAGSRANLLNQVVAVVAEARKIGAVHREMDAALADEARAASGAAAPSPAAVQAQALADLARQAVNAELFFGAGAASSASSTSATAADSGVKSMWFASASHSAALSQNNALLDRFSGLLLSMPSISLQSRFHLLENVIQRALAATMDLLSHQSSQTSLVDKQRETLDGNLSRELAPLRVQQKEQSAREAELLKRKAELLNELDKIEASLEIVGAAKLRTGKNVAAIEDTYMRHKQSLQENNAGILGRAAALQQDQTAAHAIHALIVGSYERLSASTESQLQRLMSANAQRMTKHLHSVGQYLAQQHALVEFLAKRVAFCTSRLSTLRADHEAAAALGVSLGGAAQAETERSLSALTKQDQKVLLSARAGCNALLKHVARSADAGAKSIPPTQLAQLYTQLLSTLESRKVAASFELQPLRDCVHKLAAAAQRALEEAANGNSNGAAQNGAAAPLAAVAAPRVVPQAAAAVDLAEVDAFSQAAKQPRKPIGVRVRERGLLPAQGSSASPPAPAAAAAATANGTAAAPASASASSSPPAANIHANARNGQAKKGAQANGAANGAANGRAGSAKTANGGVARGAPAAAATAAAAGSVPPQSKPAAVVASTAVPSKSWATSLSPLPPASVNDGGAGVEAAFPALSSANLQQATAQEKRAAKKMQMQQTLPTQPAAASEPAAVVATPAAEASAPVADAEAAAPVEA